MHQLAVVPATFVCDLACNGAHLCLNFLKTELGIPDQVFRIFAYTKGFQVVGIQCRRQTVRSLVESLRKTGFVVEPPKRDAGADDVVVVHASKPSGSRAKFRVDLDGGFAYKFDHYEGQECAKDIDQVVPMLQEIYGIELSNERVTWENPDRIDRTARPLDGSSSEHSHE